MDAAAFLADIVKCYENIPHDVLLAEAIATNFSLDVLRLAMVAYTAARRIVRYGACSSVVNASRSVLAGCTHATALLKSLLMRTLDRVTSVWSGVKLRVVVDDITAQCAGKASLVERNLAGAAAALVKGLQEDLRLPVSVTKTVAMASSNSLAWRLVKKLRSLGFGFPAAKHSRLLGVDYASGRKRTSHVQRGRLSALRQCLGRYQALQRACARTVGLAKTWACPSIKYGSTVIGITDTCFRKSRRMVASAAGRAGSGRSITLGMMLADPTGTGDLDLAYAFTVGPAKAWAREVWDGISPSDCWSVQ